MLHNGDFKFIAVFGQNSLSFWVAMHHFLVNFILKQIDIQNILIIQLSRSCEVLLWIEMKSKLISYYMSNLQQNGQFQIIWAKYNLNSIVGQIFELLLIT